MVAFETTEIPTQRFPLTSCCIISLPSSARTERLYDDKESMGWNSDNKVTKLSQGETSTPCKPVNNILFLKTHKTGSSTVTNILYRYGDKRDLLFALPRGGSFGWPGPFLLSSATTFDGAPNILCNHARYNKAPMHWLFPKETTRYITVLREPSTHLESVFNYYSGIRRSFEKKGTNGTPLENFLQNATYYFDQMKLKSSFTLLKNPALFDLGLDTKYHENLTVVENYIRVLKQEFDLVMLMEYFDESLVLLKRRFCWKMEDILYFKLNERLDKEKQKVTRLAKEQIRNWNSADVLLYQVFNQTLWQMIELEGPDFSKDLALFREEKEAMENKCLQEGNFLTHPWGRKTVQGYAVKSNISKDLQIRCDKMIMNELPYLDYLRKKMAKQLQAIRSFINEPDIS